MITRDWKTTPCIINYVQIAYILLVIRRIVMLRLTRNVRITVALVEAMHRESSLLQTSSVGHR